MLLELIFECCKVIFQWPYSTTDQTKRYMVLMTNFYYQSEITHGLPDAEKNERKTFWKVLSKFIEQLKKTFLIQELYSDNIYTILKVLFTKIMKF